MTAEKTAPRDVDGAALWRRWVLANGVAELVGLTATMAMAAGAFSANDGVGLPLALAVAFGVAVLGAAVEGVTVGGLQWVVLRRVLPELSGRSWILATSLGALVAWALGMLPATLASAQTAAAASPPPAAQPVFEPALWLQLVLAAGMGLVLGPVLGVPQWLVLRRHFARAGWWVAANSIAWAFGMPMIFLATSLISEGDPAFLITVYVALGCLAAGLVVGAVHGAWLVRLLRSSGLLSEHP